MKAVLTSNNVSNGWNYSRDKELVSAYSIIGKIDGKLREVVTARCYMGRSKNSSVVYASLWTHGTGISIAGHGKAGGYGYHKESAAIAGAISSAGIELYGSPYAHPERYNLAEDRAYTPQELAAHARKLNKQRAHIGGCGSESAIAALKAIAKAIGAKGELLVISH